MVDPSLRARIESHRWYQTIDLGHGLVTRGVDDTPKRLATIGLPASLAGLSVLDIGAWDGFFSFECERRGASRVVAADYYSWHSAEGWGRKDGFLMAREALGSKVEDVDIDVMDLSPERVGTFDVTRRSGLAQEARQIRSPFGAPFGQTTRRWRPPRPLCGWRLLSCPASRPRT